jgi:N-methylhydantoinase A
VRIGVDVGGTFTDLVALDDSGQGRVVLKVPSTPSDPSVGVVAGLDQLLAQLGETRVSFLGHGTTAGTNAFLTRKGAKVALLATEGFTDVLEFRRMDRSGVLDPYDLQLDFPQPIVPARRRFPVRERVWRDGEIVVPLTDEEVARVVAMIRAADVDAVAISLLWSFEEPAHEQMLKAALERELPGIYVTASSDIDPSMMEYERTSTTVINAYLGPLMSHYLRRLAVEVEGRGLPTPVIMQSNGGMTSIAGAADRPVALLESGPAGGVAACAQLARQQGFPDLLAVDMGGTSFDMALILEGEPQQVLESDVEGYAVRVPMLDIRSIGAGGGRIAWVDVAGTLQVGPDSAGATPGPACYGRGGIRPTVSDANAVLGYLGALTGGSLALDVDAARSALETITGPLGMTAEEVASSIYRIVNAHMADAMRVIIAEKGISPAELVLYSYGGAGGTHAAALAHELDIRRTIIPPNPGAMSALGVGSGDLVHDHVRSVMRPIEAVDHDALETTFASMEEAGLAQLQREGVPDEAIEVQRSAVVRYIGQLHHLEVQLPGRETGAAALTQLADVFHKRHRALYGFSVEDEPVFIISALVRVVGRIPKPRLEVQTTDEHPTPSGTRRVWFEDVGFVDCALFDRRPWKPFEPIAGPAVINEYDSTTVVLPGQHWTSDAVGAIHITSEDPNT